MRMFLTYLLDLKDGHRILADKTVGVRMKNCQQPSCLCLFRKKANIKDSKALAAM
jgi:hypothetical protein